MLDKLKACPFCGNDSATWYTQYGGHGYFAWVECDLCGARTKSVSASVAADNPAFLESIAAKKTCDAWNRRSTNG